MNYSGTRSRQRVAGTKSISRNADGNFISALPPPPSTLAFANNILMNIPFAKSTSNPSGIPYRVCFLINFHAPSRDIWQLYRPHDEYSQLDRTLLSQHQFLYLSSSSSLRGGDTCIREKGRGWIPRDGFNWISNRKRIVKIRFGYVFVSKGDVSVRRRGGRRDVCATLGFVVHYCHRVFVVRFERDFSSFSSLRDNPIQRRYEKEESALINLKFKDIFRIFVSFDLIFLYVWWCKNLWELWK